MMMMAVTRSSTSSASGRGVRPGQGLRTGVRAMEQSSLVRVSKTRNHANRRRSGSKVGRRIASGHGGRDVSPSTMQSFSVLFISILVISHSGSSIHGGRRVLRRRTDGAAVVMRKSSSKGSIVGEESASAIERGRIVRGRFLLTRGGKAFRRVGAVRGGVERERRGSKERVSVVNVEVHAGIHSVHRGTRKVIRGTQRGISRGRELRVATVEMLTIATGSAVTKRLRCGCEQGRRLLARQGRV